MDRLPADQDEVRDLSAVWWLLALVGLASLVAGVILVAEPSHSLTVLAVVVGIFLLFDGIIELIEAFRSDVGNRALSAIAGTLGIIVGIALVRHPFSGVTAVGLLIGIWLVAAGVLRFCRAVTIHGHRLFHLTISVVEIVAGIVIVSDPHIGYTTLAVLTGIWLIINGVGMIGLGVVMRGMRPNGVASHTAGEVAR